ncbi:hypothetical protein SAMN02745248_02433 [Hathewaya proteolytica DSM 3090]|uniref:Uncharacterized protein n=1 Tax=Hathewaya proteolytica DSM 3090 TaxID=1121331 RepID=A0A1M6S2F7_9CLOT|nr:hypothetical protein [Hathewaya proteolytica]SHK38905.1 hypothetical protein SAMN02745248_02433 [Hathewaya proteolytica DSM 3090]
MGKKIDEAKGKKIAISIAKDIIENGLTLNQAGVKHNIGATSASKYVRMFIEDKKIIEAFNKNLHYNKIHCPKSEREIKKYSGGKIEVTQLIDFYNIYAECDEPKHAIAEGKRAAKTTWEIAEKEYRKWRNEYVTRFNRIRRN